MIGIWKESYWSPLSVEFRNFDIWRHFCVIMTSFLELFGKIPCYYYRDVFFFVKTLWINIEIAEIKSFRKRANLSFYLFRTKTLKLFESYNRSRCNTIFINSVNFIASFLDNRYWFSNEVFTNIIFRKSVVDNNLKF